MIVRPVERTTGVTVTVGVGIGVAVNVCVGVADCATIGVADCVLVGAKLGFSVAGYVCAAASAASVRPETSGSSVEGLASSIERLASVPDRSVVFTGASRTTALVSSASCATVCVFAGKTAMDATKSPIASSAVKPFLSCIRSMNMGLMTTAQASNNTPLNALAENNASANNKIAAENTQKMT